MDFDHFENGRNKMRKFVLIFFLINVFLSIYPESSEKKMERKITDFRIEVITHYFGRKNNHITVTSDKLKLETSVALNKKNYSISERPLKENERNTLMTFLSDFPLESFKEEYYNKGVKDGTHVLFTIKINGIEKNIYVANYYIRELGDLAAVIAKLMPEDHINYRPGSVSTPIEK